MGSKQAREKFVEAASRGGSGAAGPVTRRISLGEHEVVTDLYGGSSAPAVLLLHGIPGWRGTWRAVASRLGTAAQVWAPDLLGFGESSEPSGALHAAGQAEMLVALIRQELRRPVHVVGFDFGGPTAVLLYARAPELLASLTLAATNVFTDTDVPLPLRSVRLPLLGDLFGRLFFGRLGLSALWLNAVSRKDRLGFWRFREPLRFPRGVVWTRRIFQSSLRNLETLYAPVEATLPTFRIPCAVLWGGRDPFFPLAVGERTAASIPNARFVSFASCGHFLPEEEPEGVAAAISALVSEAETGTPPAAARRRVGAS